MKFLRSSFLVFLVVLITGCSDNSSSNSSGSTTNASYAYVTDGANLKVIDITDPTAPTFESSITTFTSYFVSVSPGVAYVATADAINPYISLIDISNPSIPALALAMPKDNTIGITFLSDLYTDNGIGYLTDLNGGLHTVDLINASFNLQVNTGADAMSVTKTQNNLFTLEQAGGLTLYDLTNPSNPIATGVSNNLDVDISSYGDGSFLNYHSWLETDGTSLYVANIIDKKLKKFDTGTLTLQSEILIDGHATTFSIDDNIAYITMKPGTNAPLQNSYDGIKMYDLTTFTLLDSIALSGTRGCAVNGDYVYVTDANALHIYNISSGSFVLESSLAAGAGNYVALGE